LEELTNSIITGDFLVQKSVIKKIGKLDYYESRLEALSKIDFEKTRMLIIEHGVNDYLQQTAPAQVESTLRDIILKLQKRYPKLQIWVCSPTFCYIVRDGERVDCDTTDLGEFVLEEYILAEERVCKELGIGFVNNYHQDIITKETIEQYVLDGLHLNEDGRQIMAKNILQAIKLAEE
jgi:lysophospholipase L1-like esterase